MQTYNHQAFQFGKYTGQFLPYHVKIIFELWNAFRFPIHDPLRYTRSRFDSKRHLSEFIGTYIIITVARDRLYSGKDT